MTKLKQYVALFLLLGYPYIVESFVPEDSDFIVFLFFALFIGALITYLISRFLTELHYTVVIFFLGVLIAVIFNRLVDDTDLLRISVLQWEGFSGELIIYIFLPALIFGDSMTLNFYHLRENLKAASLLAAPGALFCALVTAVFVKYTLPYNWGWSISLLFGAIMCTNDTAGKKGNPHLSTFSD
jgi:CPA1 family monovalent cation:H+ antiporter